MTLPDLIPRSVLFGNPDHMATAISPDGTRLGWVAPEDGVLNVWVGPLDGSSPAQAVTHDRDRGVRTYAFCHDDRHLVYLQDTAGDESWRLYVLDLETGEATLATPGEGVQARIIGHNRWHRGTVLVALNARDPQLHDVHALDLATGELTLVAENPGFVDWLVDSEMRLRGALTMDADGGAQIHLRRTLPASADAGPDPEASDPASYELWLEVPPDDAASTDVLGFTRDETGGPGALLLMSSIDANATRLQRHDLATGEVVLLGADDRYDVAGAWQNPETLEVQAVEYLRERQEVVLLDPSLQADLDAVHALRELPGIGDGEISVGRRERSDRWWTVAVSPSDGPVNFFVYDRTTRQARHLFPHRAELVGRPLAVMEPFSFTARDGLTVHGYLTFPSGVERSGLPAVLNVHGGPWARDTWGFDPEAQWLANRGYVCVQVNFRASTGYGKAFLNAGDKQWGAAMQDDLTDAVAHVVAQGWVDPDRVGIYGGSYGGYAVLAGAAFTPDLYRCGVDIVGPSNLATLLASVPEYWRPLISMMYRRVGNPETEADLLEERSPLSAVDKIRIPLLVVQGANDPRVKQAEAEQIVAALTAKGLPHEYLLFEDEGHGLAKPQNRERMYARAEAFLAEHLGGRVEPPAAG
ncbi:S9 family peptidase [Kineosporia sp. R_H_3]|uniref:S9 family peptidase n=1 Tax=Kineosporia sp. R_H_3 TaxID=1961848 RepID=UPI0018E99509|nr:S9 family peptidase [Kineosporia sp. R_H_3]